MKNAADRKKSTYDKGRWAEALSAFWLTCKGYRVLAQRYRTHQGEVDLIAARGRILVAVEVKARPTIDEALLSITPRQRQRIEKAAQEFLTTRTVSTGATDDWVLRFDVMLVSPWKLPHHIPNAWQM